MDTHPSILTWKIPRTEEPGRLYSTGCKESDTTERLTHTIQDHAQSAKAQPVRVCWEGCSKRLNLRKRH